MKILLLGAAGFIGTNLTIELAKKTEDEITLVDRSKAFFKPIVSMDLKNRHPFIFCGADVQGCGPFIGRPVGGSQCR